MKKRICSIVLAVLMLVCFTIPAFAADVSNTTIIDCGDGYYLKVTLTEYVPEAATRAFIRKPQHLKLMLIMETPISARSI